MNDAVCVGAIGAVGIPGKIARIIALAVRFIQVIVPILLIVWGMLDLGKAVMAQKDDEIKNAQKLFIKKLIIAILVFLVPTFIGIALNVVDTSDSNGVKSQSCWQAIF